MKFATVLFVGLAAADMSYMSKRQIDKMLGIFQSLTEPVKTLKSQIDAYQSGPGDDILAQSDKIVQLVKQSVGVASSSSSLPLAQAGELVQPVEDFSELLQHTIGDLVAKKQLAVANNLGGKVYANLMKQAEGAQALATAIKSKMPSSLASTADELSGYITNNITLGVKAFADQAGAGAGAGAGAAGGASSPSSSTSASGSAGGAGAGMSLSPAGSSTSLSGSGAGAGMSSSGSSGMSGMAGAGAGAGASSPMTTSAPGAGPAVFTGAGASFKPASVFGLVAVAAAAFAF